MQLSAQGLKLVKQWEGYREHTYLDVAGFPTIGYGHRLLASESFPNGIDETQANEILTRDVHGAEQAVTRLVKVALTQTNSFGISVKKLLEEHFPGLKFETAVQYGAQSASNPQGIAAGNFVQAFAKNFNGNETCFCAFTEKMRGHKLETRTSSFKRKVSSGTWGAIIKYPIAFASMLGV